MSKTIYDETLVPNYTLPDPLITLDGTAITSQDAWMTERRPEILQLFEDQVYGKMPELLEDTHFDLRSSDATALDGIATRKQIRAAFGKSADDSNPSMDLLCYLPNNVQGPVPMFVGLNFAGNHTIHSDPAILIPRTAAQPDPLRGTKASRWQLEMILARGYGLATIYYGDLLFDDPAAMAHGLPTLLQQNMAPGELSAITIWAWGLSRAMDYFEMDDDIDADRVAVMGHSRLGKTALWAGAQDERFSMVISNNSGCGGAALSRRCFGETVDDINSRFPHWFCENFKQYNGNESALPVDQHMLLALIAPRPLYVASAENDLWSDPLGEFLATQHASPVYELCQTDGLATTEQPALHTPIMSTIGAHLRAGEHDVTQYDWMQYLNFADRYLALVE